MNETRQQIVERLLGVDQVVANTYLIDLEGDFTVEELRAIADTMDPPAAPKWTKEPPQAPGFYWYRRTSEAKPMIIQRDTEGACLWFSVYDLDPLEGEWSGPLEPPQ